MYDFFNRHTEEDAGVAVSCHAHVLIKRMLGAEMNSLKKLLMDIVKANIMYKMPNDFYF